jgi:two-component system, LuxR family, response regulator FixJ
MTGRLFVIDDDEPVREGLKLMLETEGYTVELFPSAEVFLETLQPNRRGCIILDLRLPGMSGTELQAELGRHGVNLPIVFLTAHGDIPMTVSAVKAGASDVLVKPVEAKKLLERIKQMMDEAAARDAGTEETREQLQELTSREREVLVLAAEGMSNKDIAAQLGISFRTVEVHRAHLMQKIDASSVVDLLKFVEAARQAKLLP